MPVVMLAGPIKAWWDDEWNTPEHWKYALWRERVNTELVKSYFLVYRPHEAFQGTWDERGQSINDYVLRICDVVINMTPPGVPSMGTDGEVLYARNFSKAIIDAPPPEKLTDWPQALIEMNQKLTALGLSNKPPIEQVVVKDSLAVVGDLDHTLIKNWIDSHWGEHFRFHYLAFDGTIAIFDTYKPEDAPSFDAMHKIEILAN